MNDASNNLVGLVLISLVAVALIAALVWTIIVLRRGARLRRLEQQALEARELAVIIEESQATIGGAVCIVALLVCVIGALFGYSRATTVFQQIEAGVSLMAGTMLFGLGASLGRSRTYRIYRSMQREA